MLDECCHGWLNKSKCNICSRSITHCVYLLNQYNKEHASSVVKFGIVHSKINMQTKG